MPLGTMGSTPTGPIRGTTETSSTTTLEIPWLQVYILEAPYCTKQETDPHQHLSTNTPEQH
jgi:hypothetical protein